MKRVVFLGAKPVGFRCLTYLLDRSADLNASVVGVLTNSRGQDVLRLCQERELPVLRELDDLLRMDPFDVLISVQYHEILRQRHIESARDIAVNLHMAPLPEYRGSNQFSYAIINGDQEFGTTLHVMTEAVDGGDIIAEDRFPIPGGCFVDELHRRTVERSVGLFERVIGSVIEGSYTRVPQEKLLGRRRTSFHFRREIEELKRIDLSWPADRIERHVRATLYPGVEPPYTMIGERKIYFSAVQPVVAEAAKGPVGKRV